MIDYKNAKVKEIALHYAELFKDQTTHSILEAGSVQSAEEALHLATFFWKMVDASVEDIKDGKTICGQRNLEAWNETTMNTFRSYLRSQGYGDQWEEATDNA